MQGETVPYVICVEKDAEGNVGANQKGLAERAHHPEEINAASHLAIDAEYYLTQQVYWLQVFSIAASIRMLALTVMPSLN